MRFLLFLVLTTIFSISITIAGEKEYVSEITFIGNLELTDIELKSVIKLQMPKLLARSEYSAKKLNRDRIFLETYYKSKGFIEVKIIEEYEVLSDNYIKIIFSCKNIIFDILLPKFIFNE